jgi:hypothetical protein
MWAIYDELMAAAAHDSVVSALVGLNWFLVWSRGVGVAIRLLEGEEVIPNAGRLAGMKTREVGLLHQILELQRGCCWSRCHQL